MSQCSWVETVYFGGLKLLCIVRCLAEKNNCPPGRKIKLKVEASPSTIAAGTRGEKAVEQTARVQSKRPPVFCPLWCWCWQTDGAARCPMCVTNTCGCVVLEAGMWCLSTAWGLKSHTHKHTKIWVSLCVHLSVFMLLCVHVVCVPF